MVLVLQNMCLKKKEPPIAKNQRYYLSYPRYEAKRSWIWLELLKYKMNGIYKICSNVVYLCYLISLISIPSPEKLYILLTKQNDKLLKNNKSLTLFGNFKP